MSNPCFHFRRFDVFHDLCAMKVGTDGVLLGAWVSTGEEKRILDVGTGSGLIALMLAQRTNALIDAVEIDDSGFEQAARNVLCSPWPDRVLVKHADYRDFTSSYKYDLIVSNPPFFRNSLKTPSKKRNLARHDESLTWEQLIIKSAELLDFNGRLAVILPFEAYGSFESICWQHKLYLIRRCEVSTSEGRSPKRLLLEFSHERTITEHTCMAIETGDHSRTVCFSTLTSDFYL